MDKWLIKHFKKLITYQGEWQDIIKVCLYFLNNPCPGLYIRELPVEVHTKFIEEHKSILRQLLDVLIPEHINKNETIFEKRFNLKYDEPLIRILLLDNTIAAKYFSGITDISIKVSAFEKLFLPLKRVFILENKTNFSNIYNFLTLPQMKDSIALFGKGFGAGLLEKAEWLKDKTIYYWGDIDTHGLLILNQLRKSFPQTTAFLMDRETLTAHKKYWGQGEQTIQESPLYLTDDEKDLFRFLKKHNVRLEQEKIEHEYVLSQIRKLE